MNKSIQAKMKIFFRSKIALIIFGVFLTVIILEIGLRLGGQVLLSIQEYRNYLSVKKKGAYRILCLGESTTAGQYQCYLEEMLNQRNLGITFSVVDKGIPAINTRFILSQLENNLNRYHPDMVIAMMGINTDAKIFPYEYSENSKTAFLVHSFRTYKLARLLWLHTLAKAKEIGLLKPTENKNVPMSQFSLSEYRFKDYPEQIKSVLSPEAQNQNIIDAKTDFSSKYIKLGDIYRQEGNSVKAEEAFRKAIELNPQDYRPYVALARFYRMAGKNTLAEESYNKAIELDPKRDDVYCELGNLYAQTQQYLQAVNIYKRASSINPGNIKAYTELGWVYSFQGEYAQAEKTLREAIEHQPVDYVPYAFLAELYRETGKYELAKECIKKANELGLTFFYTPEAQSDYLKLSSILRQKGIRLACIQYPMRSIISLKKIMQTEEGIIFVDNEKIFKDAIKKSTYNDYFIDIFAGDFGHCTKKGNRLLAENIANVILKEVFGK